MADKDTVRLTKVEIAGVCGRFARLQSESKKPIGYSSLAEMAAHNQRHKLLQSLKQVKPLGDEEIEEELGKYYSKEAISQSQFMQVWKGLAQESHQYVIDQMKSLIGVDDE